MLREYRVTNRLQEGKCPLYAVVFNFINSRYFKSLPPSAAIGKKVLNMAPGLEHLNILPIKVAAYAKTQSRMTFFDPSRAHDFLFISGTNLEYVIYRRVLRYYSGEEDGLDMRKALSQDVEKKSIIPLKRPVTPDELEYD